MDSWDLLILQCRHVLEEFVSAEDQQAPPAAAALFDADDFRGKLGRYHHPPRLATHAHSPAEDFNPNFNNADVTVLAQHIAVQHP